MYSVTDLNYQQTILDKEGYVRLGQRDILTIAEAVNLIASYDSQCADLVTKKSWSGKHKKVFSGYAETVCNWFQEDRLKLYRDTGCEDVYDSIEGFISYDPDLKSFYVLSPYEVFIRQSDLLSCLEDEDKLDVPRLRSYLIGEAYFETDQEKAGNARWREYREPMKAEVEQYVNALLDAGCLCDHAQVSGYAWTKFLKENDIVKLYTDTVKDKFERYGMSDFHMYLKKKNVTDIAREVFETRARGRIFKVNLHKRYKDCSVDHLSIK